MWFSRQSLISVIVLSVMMILPSSVFALTVPPAPTDHPILDQTNTLTAAERAHLGALIAAEREQTSNQIALLMIPSLQGDSLEEFSLDVARAWGIGEKDKDNGVLIFVAKDDRLIRIEVGYGLEGALPDAQAGRIIRERMLPFFREGAYYQGLEAGLTEVIATIHGEGTLARSDNPLDEANIDWEFVFFLLFAVPVWLGSILARSKSWWAGGAIGAVAGIILGVIFGFVYIGIISTILLAFLGLLFDWAVSKNYRERSAAGLSPSWWAGGSHFGGGSGGFGGFGGGGFGGGGASSKW